MPGLFLSLSTYLLNIMVSSTQTLAQIKAQEFVGHIKQYFVTIHPVTYVTNDIQDFVKNWISNWVDHLDLHLDLHLWPNKMLFDRLQPIMCWIRSHLFVVSWSHQLLVSLAQWLEIGSHCFINIVMWLCFINIVMWLTTSFMGSMSSVCVPRVFSDLTNQTSLYWWTSWHLKTGVVQVRSGQVRSECLMCRFRASCCSARLSRAQVLTFAGSSVWDRLMRCVQRKVHLGNIQLNYKLNVYLEKEKGKSDLINL